MRPNTVRGKETNNQRSIHLITHCVKKNKKIKHGNTVRMTKYIKLLDNLTMSTLGIYIYRIGQVVPTASGWAIVAQCAAG